uniref:Transcriptional regulator n=1 Tax=Caulobacter phage BL57 TaxID=3348355 RepID=A0AB74UMZ0_9VIRU
MTKTINEDHADHVLVTLLGTGQVTLNRLDAALAISFPMMPVIEDLEARGLIFVTHTETRSGYAGRRTEFDITSEGVKHLFRKGLIDKDPRARAEPEAPADEPPPEQDVLARCLVEGVALASLYANGAGVYCRTVLNAIRESDREELKRLIPPHAPLGWEAAKVRDELEDISPETRQIITDVFGTAVLVISDTPLSFNLQEVDTLLRIQRERR